MIDNLRIIWLCLGDEYDNPTSGGMLYNFVFIQALKKRFGESCITVLNLMPDNVKFSWFMRRVYTNIKYLSYFWRIKEADVNLVMADCRGHSLLLFPIIFFHHFRKVPIGLIVHHLSSPLSNRKGLLGKWERFSEKCFIRCASFVIVNSSNTRQSVINISDRSEPELPIFIVPPGLKTCILPNVLTGAKNDQSTFRMLFVGNCDDPRKGLDYLIHAVFLLPDHDFMLYLVGNYTSNSTYHQQLCNLIKIFGLSNQVTFLGRVGDVELSNLYHDSDLFVLPSLWEGYGIVLAEAMSHGLPVVSTKVGAIPEIIQDGVNGILVPPCDSKAIASAINSLASDLPLRLIMRDSNLESAKKFQSWEAVGKKLTYIVEQSCEGLTQLSI